MKKMLVCLVVLGALVVGTLDASAYTSHNWRAWATTAGYVDGKLAGYGPEACCAGPMCCTYDGCMGNGLIPIVLSIPCMVVNSLMGGTAAILCCGPQWSPVPWGPGTVGCYK